MEKRVNSTDIFTCHECKLKLAFARVNFFLLRSASRFLNVMWHTIKKSLTVSVQSTTEV